MTVTLTRRAALAAAFMTPAIARAATPLPPEPLDSAALAADADILEAAWRALHPGLFRYNTPATLTGHFARLRRDFTASRTRAQAFVALARMAAAVRCGHTFPSPYNQRRAVEQSLFSGINRMPFRFAWIGGRMVVHSSLDPAIGLKPGTVIEAVNGRSATAMLADLMPLTSADGHNDARRVRNLELRGAERWQTFDILAPMLWPDLKDQAVLTLAGGRRLSVPLQSAETRAAQRPDMEHGAAPVFTLQRLPGGVARLTMPTWALYDSAWDWKAWLGAQMDALAEERARGLIVDIRGNGGGLDCGNVIVSRLIGRDLHVTARVRRTRYRAAPQSLWPYLDTWDPSFRDWGADATGPDAQGFYRMTRFDDDPAGEVIRPEGRRFTGKVVVLMDASNASATFQFTRLVKERKLATLVGQTNGGNLRGINGSAYFFLRLPGSGLEVDTPLVGEFPLTPQPDAGVTPHVFVPIRAADIAAGRDADLEAALKRLA